MHILAEYSQTKIFADLTFDNGDKPSVQDLGFKVKTMRT